ncbi:MAG: hypothetical protein LLG05_13030, partial [Porphyromonadaceae bacterium]|nr:hypothetical protein [Porphyromonadaceae bacterium]
SNEKAEQIAIEQIELAKLKVAREQSNAAEKAGTLSTEDAIRLKGQIIEKETQHKIALAGLNSELRNEVKTNVAVNGSMDQLSQQLVRMKAEFKAMAPAIRDGSIGQALNKEIQSVDSKLKTLDASIGNYQRNVGDYASGMYGLSYSIQQVARELPNIAISPQMFIMAISNNLPILQDELRRASIAYKALNEEHKIGLNLNKEAVPVWKQITSSIFSWQTVLVAAITIGTVFGKQIFDWIGGLGLWGKTLTEAQKAQQRFNDTTLDGVKNAQEELTKLNLLYKAATDTTKMMDERNMAVAELQKMYPSYLGNIDSEIIKAGQAASAYDLLRNSIIETAKAKAYSDKITENMREIMELEEKLPELQEKHTKELEKVNKAREKQQQILVKNQNRPNVGIGGVIAIKEAEDARNELGKVSEEINEITDKIFELVSDNDRLASGISVKSLINTGKTPTEPTEKYVNTDNQQREREREARDLEYTIEQVRIDALEDSSGKTLAQLDLNHKREMDMLDRQREDQIQKVKDNARAIFNADPANKGKKFDDNTVSLSPEEELGYSRLRNVTLARQEAERDKSYLDLLKKYQDYTTKRLEIERKFNEDIKLLESKRTEDNSVETDNAITQRTKERDEDFSSSL